MVSYSLYTDSAQGDRNSKVLQKEESIGESISSELRVHTRTLRDLNDQNDDQNIGLILPAEGSDYTGRNGPSPCPRRDTRNKVLLVKYPTRFP